MGAFGISDLTIGGELHRLQSIVIFMISREDILLKHNHRLHYHRPELQLDNRCK